MSSANRLVVLLLIAGCAPQMRPELALFANPRTISAQRPSTVIELRARTARGTPGVGVVTLAAAAGRLDTPSIALGENGDAQVTFECPEQEPGCEGVLSIVGRWVEAGLEATTQVEVIRSPSLDAGVDAAVPDAAVPDFGLADAGAPDGGNDAGLRDAGSVDAGVRDAGPPPPPTFDSRDMLLMGMLSAGAFGTSVLCDLTHPEVAYAGFTGFAGMPSPSLRAGRPMLRPSDGALYYLSNGVLRRFVSDEVITQAPYMYPVDPEANDWVVPTGGCGSDRVDSFLIRADSSIIHRCGGVWRDASGTAVPTCPGVVATSEEGASFCIGTRDQVLDPTGVLHPLTTTFTTVRAKPGGGFWASVRLFGNWERWTISADGVATQDGTYALAPMGSQSMGADVQGWGHLDGHGNYFRWFSNSSMSSVDLVMRFSADFSTASVVYSEGDAGVMCQFHSSNLITGP